MSSLQKLLKKGTKILEEAGIREAGLDAWLLLEYKTKKNRAYYFAHQEEEVSKDTEDAYLGLLRKRAEHIPLQHLTGQAFFMGYEFFVNEKVLVPRQDTEVLVEEALHVMKDMEKPGILDMCTGSGCILISLLLEKEGSTGVGVDISPEALRVAERNAESLGAAPRAVFLESNLFSAEVLQKKDGNPMEKYDILISNPPYIRTGEIENLMEEVRLFDPRIALDGYEDGLYFYRQITREASAFLKPGGWLLYEIGYDQGQAVAEMMKEAGFSQIQIRRDLAGLDRVVLGRARNEGEDRCSIN